MSATASSLYEDQRQDLYNELRSIIDGLDISKLTSTSYDSYFFAKTNLLNDPSRDENSSEKIQDELYNVQQENLKLKQILKSIEELISSTSNSLIALGFGLSALSVPFIQGTKDTGQDGVKVKSEQSNLPDFPEGYVPTVSDVIALGESAGDYNVTFGVDKYESPEDFSGGKKLTEMSLAEVMAFQNKRNQTSENTGAVGKYQFIQSTLADLINKSKLDINNTKFTPQVQEQLQSLLLKENIKGLKSRAIPTTPTNLSLAHYIGVGGVSAVERAIAEGKGDQSVADVLKEYTGQDVSKQNRELTQIKAKDFQNFQENRLKSNAERKGMDLSPDFFEKQIEYKDLNAPANTPSEIETQNLIKGNKGTNLNSSSQSYNTAQEEQDRPLIVLNERVSNAQPPSQIMNNTSAEKPRIRKSADAAQRAYSSYFAVV